MTFKMGRLKVVAVVVVVVVVAVVVVVVVVVVVACWLFVLLCMIQFWSQNLIVCLEQEGCRGRKLRNVNYLLNFLKINFKNEKMKKFEEKSISKKKNECKVKSLFFKIFSCQLNYINFFFLHYFFSCFLIFFLQ